MSYKTSKRLNQLLPFRSKSEFIYGEHSNETDILRNYHDNVLKQTPEGQSLIKLYYQWSPVIVKAMKKDEEFKENIKKLINGVLPLIRKEEK